MECEFCKALMSERYRIVFQNDHIFVLANIEPVKEGHVLILPVRHAEELKDLLPEEAQAFLRAIDRCMEAVTELFADAPMLLVNGWKYRTQAHLHAHVLPSKVSLRGLYAASEGIVGRRRAEDHEIRQTTEKFKPFFQA